ncbi:uncharacterized protein B0H18DRAFT_97190 [Fomitopsis serialis]|uniref:uncharacterized protein n=1 Tax=Fomitopsis serialis TaxID=139415 RepID=UPI0020083354|nr:uncharacterized protein B0H18DRAFT_97190 [Neoantrodia serialis]KAH9915405.1 hypothetical protein B0H18DRAFT_97190 [Neoantrodia serialis]
MQATTFFSEFLLALCSAGVLPAMIYFVIHDLIPRTWTRGPCPRRTSDRGHPVQRRRFCGTFRRLDQDYFALLPRRTQAACWDGLYRSRWSEKQAACHLSTSVVINRSQTARASTPKDITPVATLTRPC